MNLNRFKEMSGEIVIQPMLDYMKYFEEDGEECPYTTEHVKQCETLLNGYLSALAALAAPTDEAIMSLVEEVILALNELNNDTEDSLIETEAREALWQVIQESAVECGLSDECIEANEGDITGEWRDW
ncbi:MAG: hypothetical protein IJE08_11460 [Clostridia bacterium]|nr:hypothetical protein [Clostridia bacterium]